MVMLYGQEFLALRITRERAALLVPKPSLESL